MEDRCGFELVDHVSDLRLRAWGSSLRETLAQASAGLWSLIADPPSVPLKQEWTVRASGRDIEELLVNLLNEQILAFDGEGLVAGRVESVSVAERAGNLEGAVVLWGCRGDELPCPPSRYLKAATFHDLVVLPTLVEVTLDV